MDEKKPFDDGNEFVQKHLGISSGSPTDNQDTQMPLALKIMGIFILGFIGICFILLFVAFFIHLSN